MSAFSLALRLGQWLWHGIRASAAAGVSSSASDGIVEENMDKGG